MPSQLFLVQILIYKKKKKSKGWHRNKTFPKFPHKLHFLMSIASVLHVCSSFISWLEYLFIYHEHWGKNSGRMSRVITMHKLKTISQIITNMQLSIIRNHVILQIFLKVILWHAVQWKGSTREWCALPRMTQQVRPSAWEERASLWWPNPASI